MIHDAPLLLPTALGMLPKAGEHGPLGDPPSIIFIDLAAP